MTRRRAWQVAFATTATLSLVVLFAPGSDVPSSIPISDKIIHFLLFVSLAASGRSAGFAPPRLLVGLVAYAGVSEVLQTMLPINRDGDVRDALADTLGVVAGLGLATLARRRSA